MFRRGATSRAQAVGIPQPVIEWVNRWGTSEEVIVKGPMRIIYTDKTLMLEKFLEFSAAL
jgi:hypothetical protein